MTVRVRLATGPVSWGVDFAEAPGNPSWPAVLDGIERSGYRYTELGPLGYLPQDPETLREELERRHLEVAGSFVFQPLSDRDQRGAVLSVTRKTCELISGVGGGFLVVIDLVDPVRARTAGRSADATRTPDARWSALMTGIREVASVAVEEFDLRPVLHPHAGSRIEFEDEIARAMDELDPELIGLCIDTGHSAYAGLDPVDLCRIYMDRIEYLHLKDVDPTVRALMEEERLDFWSSMEKGVFCPVGEGMVNFTALHDLLADQSFDGWATVEQDRAPDPQVDPVADVVKSRGFLEEIGLSASEARTG